MEIKVLVVEDNEDQAETTRRILLQRTEIVAYSVQITGTLKGALDSIKHQDFDAVLLDLGLPDSKDGLESVRAIRRNASEKTAVVVCTGRTDKETIDAVMAAGADAYLAKPVEPKKISASLQLVVANKAFEISRSRIEKPLSELGSIMLQVRELISRPIKEPPPTDKL